MPSSYYVNSQRVSEPSNIEESGKTEDRPNQPDHPILRKPLIPRDRYDGVDSDDETDSEEERINTVGDRGGENSESEDERPQVVGEVEIDMKEEEEEFVRFSRETLGITDDMWKNIVKEREARGGALDHIMTPFFPN